MKKLIERSYKAIKGRCLITNKTTTFDFIKKMKEELKEVEMEQKFTTVKGMEKYIEEVTDLATVCIMQIKHLGYDFETEFEKVVLKNEKRANNETKE